MRKWRMNHVVFLIVLATLFGIMAQAQKSEDDAGGDHTTLADLGVTEAQELGIKALWELKRQNQIHALNDLKILNRLAKDSVTSEDEIRETLKELRQRRLAQEQQIQSVEQSLIESLSVRAQLHLTILGVLENGLARRVAGTTAQRTSKGGNKQEDGGRERRTK